MRRLLAHAFTDTALLEQEPLLAHYFDFLIERLKQQIDGSARGRVNLAGWYNFTTFDIIGYDASSSRRWPICLTINNILLLRDLTLGEPFGALETGQYHSWIASATLGATL